jgi:hypothetical protein
MKQTTISIETARAMYEQGGTAKEFALENFTETELQKPSYPKQTAVEWYIEQEQILGDKLSEGIIGLSLFNDEVAKLKIQAKQMEKEQIIEADLAGVERTLLDFSKFPNLVGDLKETLSLVNDMKEGRDSHDNGIEYYNETYGKTKN